MSRRIMQVISRQADIEWTLLSYSKKLVLPVSLSSLAEHAHLSHHRDVGDPMKHDSTSERKKNHQRCLRRWMNSTGTNFGRIFPQ